MSTHPESMDLSDSRVKQDDESSEDKQLMALCSYIRTDRIREIYGYSNTSKQENKFTPVQKSKQEHSQIEKINQHKDINTLVFKKSSQGPRISTSDRKDEQIKMNRVTSQKKCSQEKKMAQELHKKINIFDFGDKEKLPVLKFTNKISSKKQSTHSKDSLLYINSFSCFKEKPRSLIISQKGDYSVYISETQVKEVANGYRVYRAIDLDSVITCILYIQKTDEKDGSLCQSDSEKQVSDKLLIGCQNGCIYIVDKFSHVFDTLTDIELGEEAILNTNDNYNEEKCINQIIVDDKNKSRIFTIIQNHEIKRYDYELVKKKQQLNQGSKQHQQNLSQMATEYKFIQFDPTVKIRAERKIVCLEHIKLGKKKVNKEEANQQVCMLAYLEGMHMPCILNNEDINIWFPYQLDRLAIRHNNTLENIFGTFPEPNRDNTKMECQQMINEVRIVKYERNTNKIIVGCGDGSVYFCLIQPIEEIIKQKIELNQKFLPDQDELQFKIKQQLTKYNFISFLIVRSYAFKEGNNVFSIGVMQKQSYIGIATDTKMLFYDIKQKTKFSKTLVQRPNMPVNEVLWTSNDQLLLCSTKQTGNRVYLYSNQLPIRKSDPSLKIKK